MIPEPTTTPSSFQPLLTYPEAAQRLGLSVRHLRRLVDAGKISYILVSERSPRIDPDELNAYLKRQTFCHGKTAA